MAPEGFFISEAPPTVAQLTFSKKDSPANELVGKSILFNWPRLWAGASASSRSATSMGAPIAR